MLQSHNSTWWVGGTDDGEADADHNTKLQTLNMCRNPVEQFSGMNLSNCSKNTPEKQYMANVGVVWRVVLL